MSLRLIKYLRELRHDANKFEQSDLSGVSNKSTLYRRRGVIIILSSIIVYNMSSGFSNNFVTYISTVLSILIGLFMNCLIFGMDKFYQKPTKINLNSEEIIWDKKAYNYYRQYLFVTGYTIVKSIFTLVVLSLSATFTTYFSDSFDLANYTLVYHDIGVEDVRIAGICFIVIIQKAAVFYWLFCIVYNTLFIVSSMIRFMVMKTKYN